MRILLALALSLGSTSAIAKSSLNFDTDKLCQWQFDNNSMDVEECKALEAEGKVSVEATEVAATPERRVECEKETLSYAGDSGLASYTVYAACLLDGPGSF